MQRSRAVSRQYLLEVLFYMDLRDFMGNIQVCKMYNQMNNQFQLSLMSDNCCGKYGACT